MTEPATTPYPAWFSLAPPERIDNWRPLVHWLLVIPHLVVLYALNTVSQVVGLISWFAIVFTGRLPGGLANLQAMCIRYEARALTYAAFLRVGYPPFSFSVTTEDPGDDPEVVVDFGPELEDRNRVTTFFRILLVIPHFIVLALLSVAIAVVMVIAFFAVLFTGRWPEGLRDFVVGFGRWSLRVNAYFLLLTDEYPPFTLD